MRIFLYEFITGGGLAGSDGPLPRSLLREGRAMISALAADFAAIDGVKVAALKDSRLSPFELPGGQVHEVANPDDERRAFERLAAESDWTVVIAPEFDSHLLTRTRWVEACGGRLLSPQSDLVALAGDKMRSAEHLEAAGIAVPQGRLLAPGEPLPADFPYPAVLKPIDGAGSLGVRLIHSSRHAPPDADDADRKPRRLERFCPGDPASVAFLCGPIGHIALPACRQHLADDGSFAYLGGSLPLPPALADRATNLATRAITILDAPLGYIGVDLVLGQPADGRDDVVVEINPRLTTSYVGLRAATSDNLAAAMLAIAAGRPTSLRFRPEPIQFDA